MTDEIFDVRDGQMLRNIYRTVPANAYRGAAAASEGRRGVKLRWTVYSERQRRALRALLEPAAAAVAPDHLRHVHVYTVTEEPQAGRKETAEKQTTTADGGTWAAAHKETAEKMTTTADDGEEARAASHEETADDGEEARAASHEEAADDGEEARAAAHRETADDEARAAAHRETADDEAPAAAHEETAAGGPPRAVPDDDGDEGHPRRARRGCVDLKSLAKLRRLCCTLRANVSQLRDTYQRQCGGAYYTAEESRALADGLGALYDDAARLTDEVHDADGYRDELTAAVAAYNGCESRYRALRAVDRGARLRCAAADDHAGAAAGGGNALAGWIKRFLCDPCNRLFRRFAPPADGDHCPAAPPS